MSSFIKRVCLVWLLPHFLIIGVFAFRDAASIHPEATSLEDHRSLLNPVRQSLEMYANCAGMEAGYSYFAPSVPGNCKLLFELHYPDGHLDYDVPHVAGAAAGYRLAVLIDSIALFHYIPLREALLKMLVYANWQEHPTATMIRAVLARIELPTAQEFRSGERKYYEILFSYDFAGKATTAPPGPR